MDILDRWLLPEGIEDILPDEARQLESVRRQLLDIFGAWGYEYVIPPMFEYIDSLLTGTGHDLDLKTFKVIDLPTGRTMGIRADITPQVARIDAHSLNRDGPVRLCYAGTALHSQGDNMLASRTPMKVGAEYFGDASGSSDVEIVSLMVESLRQLGITTIHLELGDVSVFRQLAEAAGISRTDQDRLFTLIQQKSSAALDEALSGLQLAEPFFTLLKTLPTMCGPAESLDAGAAHFSDFPDIVSRISNLKQIGAAVTARFSDVDIYYDLSELRGYAYHTGIVFAAYVGHSGQAIAKGGRYDDVGQVFGRPRAATGFDVLVKPLLDAVPIVAHREVVFVIGVTKDTASACWEKVAELRTSGYIVVESGEPPTSYDKTLEWSAGAWQLVDRPSGKNLGKKHG